MLESWLTQFECPKHGVFNLAVEVVVDVDAVTCPFDDYRVWGFIKSFIATGRLLPVKCGHKATLIAQEETNDG